MSSPEPSVPPERRQAALERLRDRSIDREGAPAEAEARRVTPGDVMREHPALGAVALGAASVAPGATRALLAPGERAPLDVHLFSLPDLVRDHPTTCLVAVVAVFVAIGAAVVAFPSGWF